MCWLLLLHGISWLMVWSAQNLCREWQWQWSYAQQTWLTAGEERFCLSLHTVDTWNWSVYETFVYRFIIGRCVRVIGVVRQRKTANFAYVEFCGLCITRHSATDGGVDGKHWYYYYYFFFLLLLLLWLCSCGFVCMFWHVVGLVWNFFVVACAVWCSYDRIGGRMMNDVILDEFSVWYRVGNGRIVANLMLYMFALVWNCGKSSANGQGPLSMTCGVMCYADIISIGHNYSNINRKISKFLLIWYHFSQ